MTPFSGFITIVTGLSLMRPGRGVNLTYIVILFFKLLMNQETTLESGNCRRLLLTSQHLHSLKVDEMESYLQVWGEQNRNNIKKKKGGVKACVQYSCWQWLSPLKNTVFLYIVKCSRKNYGSQRYPCCNPLNLWICCFTWQKSFADVINGPWVGGIYLDHPDGLNLVNL